MIDPSLRYNEFKQVGTDYSQIAEAEVYDSRHSKFRNVEKENNAILDTLGTESGDVIIDFGAGTGAFAIQASQRGATVHAVDVSSAMLDVAKQKAITTDAQKIHFSQDGFLSYETTEQSVDAIVTSMTLHHLPDFWKGIALDRMNKMLKPNGKLYLHDVVIEQNQALDNISSLLDMLAEAGGESLKKETEAHFREEFSTYDWVMDELLVKAGFEITQKDMKNGTIATYYCTKK